MKAKLTFLFFGLFILPLALLVGGRLPYFLLYCYCAALAVPLLHILMGKYFLRVRLKLPELTLTSGEEITLSYTITNPLPIPFPQVIFHNDLKTRLTGTPAEPEQLQLEARSVYHGQITLTCRRRGIYDLGQVRLTLSDIFHLYQLIQKVTHPLKLKVYPRVLALDAISLEASQHIGELVVHDPLFQNYSTLSHLKQYQEGDSLKKIHWKASAKAQQLIVKNFEERGDNQVTVLLDSTCGHYREDREGLMEDRLVEAALSLIHLCLISHIAVSLYFSDENRVVTVKGDHFGDLKEFLEKLVAFHPTSNEEFMERVEGIGTLLQPGSSLFVLTPKLNRASAAQGIRLKQKGLKPAFFVAQAEEIPQNEKEKWSRVRRTLKQEVIPFYRVEGEGEHTVVREVSL